MCKKTVEGVDDNSIRTVSGEADISLTSVGGATVTATAIDGVNGSLISLKGTKPTTTTLTASSGLYTTPLNCVYIQVYVVGSNGSGSGGTTGFTSTHQGGGGGAGGVAVGFFSKGTYSYQIAPSNAGGAVGTDGSGSSANLTTFDILTATGGSKGIFAPTSTTLNLKGGVGGTAINSIHYIGSGPGQAPGRYAACGGANFFDGGVGRAFQITAVGNSINGSNDRSAGGGGAGSNAGVGAGGSGSAGRIVIYEYY